jgi:DNA transformation protein
MSEPIESIRNLGPASAREYKTAGIKDAEHLRELGADAAYLKYLQAGNRPHFIGYYALVMGLQGRPWNDCQGDEKAALRAKFDTLKAAAKANPSKEKGRLDFEAALDLIGVVKRKA